MSGNVLINQKGDRVNSYNVWGYTQGHDSYYRSMLVDLTQPPDQVCRSSFIRFVSAGKFIGLPLNSSGNDNFL